MRENPFDVSDLVVEVIGGGMPAIKAFWQSSGLTQYDAAVEAGMTEERLCEIEQRVDSVPLETQNYRQGSTVPVNLLMRWGA